MSVVEAPVPPSLALRERRHRRVILFALCLLVILALSPLFAHHLHGGFGALVFGIDHLGQLCLIALRTLFEPVHGLFHLLFTAGFLYGCWDRYRGWRSANRTLTLLKSTQPVPGDRFWRAARAAGVEPRIVHVVRGLPAPAFTIGWLRPRIYLAHALADQLDVRQLTMVLAHEGVHAARRDPLRISLLRFLTCTLFWIPALRRLSEDVVDEIEIRADNLAAAGQPLLLASALVTLARELNDGAIPKAAVGFERRSLLDRRVRRLLGQATPLRSRLTRRSLIGAVATLALILVSGLAVAQPDPAEDASWYDAHCEDHYGSVIAHLFCRAGITCGAAESCRHISL